MREPAGKLRFQLLAKIRTHVQVANAGAAAEPFQNSATGKIRIERLNVDRHRAERLVSIEHDVRSDFVRLLDDRLGILNKSAAEYHMRDRNQQRLLVNGIEQAFSWNS